MISPRAIPVNILWNILRRTNGRVRNGIFGMIFDKENLRRLVEGILGVKFLGISWWILRDICKGAVHGLSRRNTGEMSGGIFGILSWKILYWNVEYKMRYFFDVLYKTLRSYHSEDKRNLWKIRRKKFLDETLWWNLEEILGAVFLWISDGIVGWASGRTCFQEFFIKILGELLKGIS